MENVEFYLIGLVELLSELVVPARVEDEDTKGPLAAVVEAHLSLLVLLLELRDGRRGVVADAGRLPTAVVA